MKKDITIMFAAQCFLALLGYSLNWLLTRFLSIEDYGQLRYAISLAGILVIVTHPGLSAAIYKSISEKYNDFVSRAYGLTVKCSLLGSLILILFSCYYFFLAVDRSTGWLIVLIAFFFPFFYYDRWNMVYIAKGLFAKARLFELTIKSLSLIGAGIAAAVTGNALVTAAGMYLSYVVLNPVFSAKSLKILQYGGDDVKQNTKYAAYAIRISRYSILPSISKHLDKILLAGLLDFKTLSVYFIATIIPVYLLNSVKSATSVPLQKWLGFGRKDALYIFRKNQKWMLLASAIVTAGLYFTLPVLLGVFGEEYSRAPGYARILSLAFLFNPYSTMFFQMMKYMDDERFHGRALGVMSCAKTIAYLIVIPFAGVGGLVWTLVAAEFVWFCTAVYRQRNIESIWATSKGKRGLAVNMDVEAGVDPEG